MEQPNLEPEKENILASVFKGMEVFDQKGDKIGTVDFVYMGSRHEGVHGAGTGNPPVNPEDRSIVRDFSEAIAPLDDVPEEIKNRMDYEGFVRVDSNRLLARDRFVLPGQIEAVEGNRVILNVPYEDLAKR